MEQFTIWILLTSLAIVMVALTALEHYLRKVYAPHDFRLSNLYQGGESISTRVRGYHMNHVSLTVFFLVLHIIGFFGATLAVLSSDGINLINWTTITFGAIVILAVSFMAQSSR